MAAAAALGSVFRVFLGNGPKTACRAPPAWKAGGVRVILPANKIRSPTKKPHKGEQTGSSIFYYLWSYVFGMRGIVAHMERRAWHSKDEISNHDKVISHKGLGLFNPPAWNSYTRESD